MSSSDDETSDEPLVDGETALMAAARAGRDDSVRTLLRAGASVSDALDHECDPMHSMWTALFGAVANGGNGDALGTPSSAGALACCYELLCAGADANGSDDCGMGLVEWAREYEQADDVVALLFAFGRSVPPPDEEMPEYYVDALAAAVGIAQQQLDSVLAPRALSHASCHLEWLLLTTCSSSTAEPIGDTDPVFSRLRALRGMAAPVCRPADCQLTPACRRTRFSRHVDRVAVARALAFCAEKAEAAAAEGTVGVLRQLSDTLPGSRAWEKLTFAAAACVGKWWDIKQARVESQRELAAAEDGFASAQEEGRRVVHDLQVALAAHRQQAEAKDAAATWSSGEERRRWLRVAGLRLAF